MAALAKHRLPGMSESHPKDQADLLLTPHGAGPEKRRHSRGAMRSRGWTPDRGWWPGRQGQDWRHSAEGASARFWPN